MGFPVKVLGRSSLKSHDSRRWQNRPHLRVSLEYLGVVFDYHHFWCFNPERLPLVDTLARLLRTWPAGVRPKIHFSTPRTEMREQVRLDPRSRKKEMAYLAPIWTRHGDFCNPFEFSGLMRSAAALEFDVMLESKAKDLAVIRLRPDLLRYAPDVARQFGLLPDALTTLAAQEDGVLVRSVDD